ncbi:MAG: phosphotransferase family protein [Proteobacteria bacterium]|nr:phosphotransferase family protein [Pseudomonadota bacterium]
MPPSPPDDSLSAPLQQAAPLTRAEQADVIDVRTDELFDEARLASYLAGRLEGSDRKLQVRQFGGGHANLTYLLRYGEGDDAVEYVLRRPPLGPVAPGSHDMKREYRALSALWRAFTPAPRAHLLCEDHDILGADFFVMERRRGIVVRREIPAEFGSGKDPVANRKLSEVVIDALVDFHQVDPEPIGLGDIGKPEGFLARQVSGWNGRYERARTDDVVAAEEVARWLETHRPESPPRTLLHNDWKLDNMAVAADDPGRCVAVYDWDMCTLGDPLCDLGTLLCSWINRDEEAFGPASMPTQTEGFMTREQAVARYAERAGVDSQSMRYYEVFGLFKMGVVLQQIYFRYHQGQTQDERFAQMNLAAQGLFQRAADRRP